MALWVNGSLVDAEAPALRADDHGITVGDGIFETMKVVDGTPFALTRHLRRLKASADGLAIALDLDEVRAAIGEVLRVDGSATARLRVTVTAGPAPFGTDRGDATPTLMVATAALTGWPETADVTVVPWQRNEWSATAGLKTISYADNVVALRYARERGADEAIFANTSGQICEGTGTNIFVGVGGRLLTPPTTSGCLPGITRELLIEWLGDVAEESMPIEGLPHCDEAFLTSSTRNVQPIRHVDGWALNTCPGPLTERAASVFAERSQDLDP